jgi:hypothetical protein
MLSDIPYSEIAITECIKERYFTKYKPKSSYDNNTELICIKGGLKIPGKYLNDYILVDNNILNNIPLNWYKMNGIKVYTNYINLLTCDTVKGLFKIDICNDCLMIVYNDKTIYVPFTITLKNDNWYNLSLNIGANNNISIFDINDEVNELFYKEFKNDNINNLKIDKIYISGSDSNLSNIRLYDCNILEKDKKLINIISQFSKSESSMIIADNADNNLNYTYLGTQR